MKHLNKWAFLLACTLAVSCSSGGSDDPDVPDTPNKPETPSQPETPNNPTSEDLAKYVCPTYNDNYTSVAAWTQRSKWNLANVHDPSVVKAADGYYYMYQTDAS